MTSGNSRDVRQSQFGAAVASANAEPVECLGMMFGSDEDRRTYFTERLREKLRDPEFRKIEGFPIGSDEDILALSDPPYYTACPNPFLEDFVRCYGKPYDPDIPYHREPFASDISEGKGDAIYNAHSYHTKVPPRAIMRYILHYTEPGDMVVDGFCGTGTTGVAAETCGNPSSEFKHQIAQEWMDSGLHEPAWGLRRVALADLSTIATFIAYNYSPHFDVSVAHSEAVQILDVVDRTYSWMFETTGSDGARAHINYTIWSDVFSCPQCSTQLVFWDVAIDTEHGKVLNEFLCPGCHLQLSKDKLERIWETKFDVALGRTITQIKQIPVLINYSVPGYTARFQKRPDEADLALIQQIESSEIRDWYPIDRMPEGGESRRNDDIGITHVHHFYTKRNLCILAALRSFGVTNWFPFSALTPRATRMHRIAVSRVGGEKQGAGGATVGVISGTLYVPSISVEMNVLDQARDRVQAIAQSRQSNKNALITTQSASHLGMASDTVDYIFTDPPFGANLMYSELNFLWEAWLRTFTNSTDEAVVNKAQGKGLLDYQRIMEHCFCEYFRILKPGRWMTVEFHNSQNRVWNAIQEAIQRAGFVVADVRTLDKKQGSFKQVTTNAAVKQDLIISAYKPNGSLEDCFGLEAGTEEGVWDFIRMHLKQLPVFVKSTDGHVEMVAERMGYLLFDRMVAFHVQRGVAVPLSASEFHAGLAQRFPKRDDMYFLEEQVVEYERKRLTVRELQQLTLAVKNESTAIQWLRQQLANKPQTQAELTPRFMRELSGWDKHEQLPEMVDLLEQNFLRYGSAGPIPAQIVNWLKKSADVRELLSSLLMREDGSVETDNTKLLAAARDRWYVPDPNKAIDLERLRLRTLLREFSEYAEGKGRLKVFRTEAVRAGFAQAWKDKNYSVIVRVAERLPEAVLQEDPDLLMYYDNASLRVG